MINNVRPVRNRGYHRTRPIHAEPVSFDLGDHAFETDYRALWVTLPASARIDRIKVSRYMGDKSISKGYPRELMRPEPMTEAWARTAAAFWLDWSTTAVAAAFPPVRLDHYVRKLEEETAAAAHMG